MMTREYSIAVTVIGGFLGAGKTTYLNRLIKQSFPSDALIIVNDFGDINIDAELIDYCDDNVMQLSNGCICCTLGGTLAEQLAQALRIRSAPGAIVIEASGVADPARIADIARLSHRLRLAEVVCVVNGSRALTHATDALTGEAWHAQVAAADVLHVNRLTPDNEGDALTLLKRVNAAAALTLERGHEEVSQSLTRKRGTMADSSARLCHGVSKTPVEHAAWRSFSLVAKITFDVEEFVALIESYDDVLVRAKGFVFVEGEAHARLLQFSGGEVRLQPTLRAPNETQLVFIGIAGERFDAFNHAVNRLPNITIRATDAPP